MSTYLCRSTQRARRLNVYRLRHSFVTGRGSAKQKLTDDFQNNALKRDPRIAKKIRDVKEDGWSQKGGEAIGSRSMAETNTLACDQAISEHAEVPGLRRPKCMAERK